MAGLEITGGSCPSCGVPWERHPGIALTCQQLHTQKLLNAELRKVDAPRQTLELLVRLGYEMECLSGSRCAELLGEDIVTFRERGWVQSRIYDVLNETARFVRESVGANSWIEDQVNQIRKDFE